jgi:hypothetical protein
MTKDEALKQVIDLIQPVAALADGTPFEHSEVIQRCVDAVEIALRALAQTQEPWCMKMNDCKTKCEDCPDEPPQRQPEQEPVAWEQFHEHLVERNFCPRCGKRTADLTTIHTCTPPIAADNEVFYGFPHGSVSAPNAGGKCVTAGETAPKEST